MRVAGETVFQSHALQAGELAVHVLDGDVDILFLVVSALVDDVLSVSFGVIIKSGYNAVKTAETIQENVKNAVGSMLGLTVAKVNVNIVNVEFAQ